MIIELDVDENKYQNDNEIIQKISDGIKSLEEKGFKRVSIVNKANYQLSVKTPAGEIKSGIYADPTQPGIYTCFVPKDHFAEIDLACATVEMDPELQKEGLTEEDITIRMWGDVYSEDYTNRSNIRRSDVMQALDMNMEEEKE